MSYATEYITSTLRTARETKGLSQRDLSAKSGVPQGHISKIERGTVDLRVSSLVELARALDLELVLVPRKSVPAVKSIARSSAPSTLTDRESARRVQREVTRLKNAISHLHTEALSSTELNQLLRQVRELQHFRLSRSQLEDIRNATQVATAFTDDPEYMNMLRLSLSRLRELRDALVHGQRGEGEIESVRPAYSLDEDDHG
jgi:transcriptional regulator with XRE-family HTH domain